MSLENFNKTPTSSSVETPEKIEEKTKLISSAASFVELESLLRSQEIGSITMSNGHVSPVEEIMEHIKYMQENFKATGPTFAKDHPYVIEQDMRRFARQYGLRDKILSLLTEEKTEIYSQSEQSTVETPPDNMFGMEKKEAGSVEIYDDPRFIDIRNTEHLAYLKSSDSRFRQRYSGEITSTGYLLDLRGKETADRPSQIDLPREGFYQVLKKAKEEFARQFPEDSRKYEVREKISKKITEVTSETQGEISEKVRFVNEARTLEELKSVIQKFEYVLSDDGVPVSSDEIISEIDRVKKILVVEDRTESWNILNGAVPRMYGLRYKVLVLLSAEAHALGQETPQMVQQTYKSSEVARDTGIAETSTLDTWFLEEKSAARKEYLKDVLKHGMPNFLWDRVRETDIENLIPKGSESVELFYFDAHRMLNNLLRARTELDQKGINVPLPKKGTLQDYFDTVVRIVSEQADVTVYEKILERVRSGY